MLTDEQMEQIGQALVPAVQRMEHSIITAAADNLMPLATRITLAAKNSLSLRSGGMSKARAMQQARLALQKDREFRRAKSNAVGSYQKAVQKAVKTAVAETPNQVQSAVADAVQTAYSGDCTAYRQAGKIPPMDGLDALASGVAKQTSKSMTTLLKSGAYKVPGGGYAPARDIFLRELERVTDAALSGDVTFGQSAKEAVRRLAKDGLKTVKYESGRAMQLDTAVRLNMQSAAAQINGQVAMQNLEKTGTKHAQVSKHWGARSDGSGGHADHQAWQGKVYLLHGNSEEYRNLTEATGYPDDPLGLFGYNCRHNMYPFWPGISKPIEWPEEPPPKTDQGKSYTYYEAAQRQRRLEREIRELKREALACEALGEKAEFAKLAKRIKAREAEYKRFSTAMELRPKVERYGVEGYNRSMAGKVAQAAKPKPESSAVTLHAQERQAKRQVGDEAISDARMYPLHVAVVKTDSQGRRSQKYIGAEATVVINPDTGAVITVWSTGNATRKKYKGKE